MTEYLKKSFTVRFKSPPKKAQCVKCGIPLDVVIYRINREPRCKECFKSTPTNQQTIGTDNGIRTDSNKDSQDSEKQ